MTPHYLRFARALALVSVTGLGATGCAMSVNPFSDGAVRDAPVGDTVTVRDGSTADAVTPPDAGDPCATCSCGFGGDRDRPPCTNEYQTRCCAAIGPLAPPELA